MKGEVGELGLRGEVGRSEAVCLWVRLSTKMNFWKGSPESSALSWRKWVFAYSVDCAFVPSEWVLCFVWVGRTSTLMSAAQQSAMSTGESSSGAVATSFRDAMIAA